MQKQAQKHLLKIVLQKVVQQQPTVQEKQAVVQVQESVLKPRTANKKKGYKPFFVCRKFQKNTKIRFTTKTQNFNKYLN